MSKKLTPLEALKNIEKEVEDFEGFDENTRHQMDRTRFQIIETKLKDYEELEEQLGFDPTIFKQDFKTLMKEHKALDVIKEKKVNVGSFVKCCANIDYEEYINGWGNWKKDILYNLSSELLTQEEYDLFKEVLL